MTTEPLDAETPRQALVRAFRDGSAGAATINGAGWAAFEQAHPRTFETMYQLWAMKTG